MFSATPFSQGSQTGSDCQWRAGADEYSRRQPAVPGKAYVFGLALYPMTVGTVTVTNQMSTRISAT